MRIVAAVFLLTALGAGAQQHPRDRQIHDADTQAWWHTTEAFSGDSMEGRDTGSAAYQRAADYVAGRFKSAGLQPASNDSTYLQKIAFHEVAVAADGSGISVVWPDGSARSLEFLQEITVTPAKGMPTEMELPLAFRGYCGKDAMQDIAMKIVVCFNSMRAGMPTAAERAANARAGHARGVINVDDPYFTIEPPRWPAAYARTVTIAGTEKADEAPLLVMRLRSEALARVIEGSGKDAAAILAAGGKKEPLESFEIPAKLRVKLNFTHREYSSPNVLAMLPGTDPALKNQVIVIAAHLDGYGYGTPVSRDNLYNGALDDAAYVALLIQFADDIKAGKLAAAKRSILFCAFTGEEKGLLGSTYFTLHPTVPVARLVADINLDQLRPLFPLTILTALAIDDSTLGDTARAVGSGLGITLRPDREPERGLLRRADHYPFLKIGVPAIGFIFGYDPGTDAERRYREWYNVRYHRPQDDLTQPVDFDAAAKFNTFFYKLTEAVANAAERPEFKAGSAFGAKAADTPAPQIAFTWDDLPAHSDLPANTSRLQIVQDILKAMRDAGLPPAYGFVNGARLEQEPGTAGVLEAWSAAGFPLGNHGWTHMNLNSHTVEQFEADVEKDEPLLQKLMGNADWKWMRLPYLAEGDTPEKRAEVRAFLQKRGYRIAGVTMSFADYAWSEPYARCVAKGDQAAVAELQRTYLAAAADDADYRRAVAKAAYGRDIPYVLLMHIGGLDAKMLPQLLAMYQQKGFQFTTLEQAEKDPVYRTDVDLTRGDLPPSTSELAKERHVSLPPHSPQIDIADLCK